MGKVILRVKGGLGNQLFAYAAARRLALVNNAELVIDAVTGFTRDSQYQRRYMLDRFHVGGRRATFFERLEPFSRFRRGFMRWRFQSRSFEDRCYLEQEGLDLDHRLLALRFAGTRYLDGYWQGEGYFKDAEDVIRRDLEIIPPEDEANRLMAEKMRNSDAVAIHMRWFDAPGSISTHNTSRQYYQRAIDFLETKVKAPHYFVFSDDPAAAQAKLALPTERSTMVSHNRGDSAACDDLWLMTQCRHFVIANSTFSWWGAWLGGDKAKIVVAPDLNLEGKTAWGFKGLIPEGWAVL